MSSEAILLAEDDTGDAKLHASDEVRQREQVHVLQDDAVARDLCRVRRRIPAAGASGPLTEFGKSHGFGTHGNQVLDRYRLPGRDGLVGCDAYQD